MLELHTVPMSKVVRGGVSDKHCIYLSCLVLVYLVLAMLISLDNLVLVHTDTSASLLVPVHKAPKDGALQVASPGWVCCCSIAYTLCCVLVRWDC